jgi:lysozyme
MSNERKKTGSKGIQLIKHFEGFYPKAYLCPAGVPTIGYGHTKGVTLGMQIDETQAERFLKEDLKESEEAVNGYVQVSINQDQFDALSSWTFNLGCGSLKQSTMLKRINERNFEEVPKEMKLWVHAKGTVLPGLVRRRKSEAELFSKGVVNFFEK